jgi:hypothetical protein
VIRVTANRKENSTKPKNENCDQKQRASSLLMAAQSSCPQSKIKSHPATAGQKCAKTPFFKAIQRLSKNKPFKNPVSTGTGSNGK